MGTKKKSKKDYDDIRYSELTKGDVILCRGDWRTIKGFEAHDNPSFITIHFEDGIKASRNRYDMVHRKKGETA